MGSYLSQPVTKKASSDESSNTLIYGASSMQGWRQTQEDAHNCILHYDTNSSYFAVYDGHGGHEVALYCSENLPQFLKQREAYKKGDFKNALEDAFLEFDATITTPEVIEKLKKLSQDSPDDEESDDDNIVLENSRSKLLHTASENLKLMLKKSIDESSINKSNSEAMDNIVSNSSSVKGDTNNLQSHILVDTKNNLSTTKNCDSEKVEVDSLISEDRVEFPDSSISKICTVGNNNNSHNSNDPPNPDTEVSSSHISNASNDNLTSSSTTKENEDILKTDIVKAIKLSKYGKPKITAQELYNSFLQLESSDEEESENEGEMDDINSSEDSSEKDEDGDEENSEDNSNDENKVKTNEYDFVREFTCNVCDEPGSNSGCTAVVAFLHGNELYVANAGDSRCIVCRNGKAIEMTFDHEPTKKEEYKRIAKAGGTVTSDCRVNGGLNLSRAIGDHAYKQNKDLSNREQMIIALPDIQKLTIHPNEDEFMFLACDGIWNCMSNQEAVDFIRPAIQEGRKKLSQICEEMFDKCLNSLEGDDNMTAIIVQFKSDILKRSIEETRSNKRLKTEESRDTHVV